MTRASQLFPPSNGIHFKDPWLMAYYMAPTSSLSIVDSGSTTRSCTTTEFFTQLAARGLQNTTDWTANTYKTLLNVTSGKGLVAAYVGPTAGGAETHTLEFTIDGVLTEITIGTLASGERPCMFSGVFAGSTEYTTANILAVPGSEALEADKATFGSPPESPSLLLPWRNVHRGIPLLRFNTSILIRAKHSANITNSTATAYSGLMYRLGL